MIKLLCPICRAELEKEGNCYRCSSNHSFDVARQGYVNLLPVEQKHSLHPGDTKQMVSARRAFLQAGFYAPIAQTLCALLQKHCPDCESVLDVGCGEGYYLRQVGAALPNTERWGMDISKDAVRSCAGQDKSAAFFVGTAARLPFEDGAFCALLSMFALTSAEEFARVLKKDGVFIQVLAGENHLPELKKIIYPEILHKEKTLHPMLSGFRAVEEKTLEFSFTLNDNLTVQNLFSMTPHVWRISKEGALRLQNTQSLSDSAQVIFNVYRKE